MAIKIAVGTEDFDEIRENHSYYVDKTELIHDLVNNTDNKVTLFTRPRRFGKTLNLKMMESFFDIRRDSREMFRGLNIEKHAVFCQKWMNRYPVLFFTLKGVEDLTYEEAYNTLKVKISDLCLRYNYLEGDGRTDEEDRRVFQKFKEKSAELAEIKNVLKILMRMMHAVHGKPVILLIDEYDVPLAKASEKNTAENGYYEKMLNVIRGMFDAGLKTNEYLKFAVVTGCLRIAKESLFTGTNNFAAYSTLDEEFSGYFGFSEEEVEKLLAYADLSEKADAVRKWYDGYVFGSSGVYCPWDVVSYASDLLKRKEAVPKNYWKNTSSNSILLTFVERTEFDVSDKFEALLNGGTITETISDELTYDTLHESEENLWSVLFMTGYLTKAPHGEKECGILGNTVRLRIPNAEIAAIFEDTVVKFFEKNLDTGKQRALMDALWNGNEEEASLIMTDILFSTISYHDYHENYYHAFLTGIISGLGYAVKSNLENGLGRTDIDVRDKKRMRGMIIEAKKSEREEEMEKDCGEAGQQILRRQYLEGFAGFKSVQCYGIAFYKKKALVRRVEIQ